MKRKVIISLASIFCLTALILFIYYFNKGDSSRWQVAAGGIGVSALPLLLLFCKRIPFNIPLLIGYYFAILCTTFLGSIGSFYLKHKWWDSSIHLYKGLYVGFLGIALYKLLVPSQARPGVSRLLLSLFILSLAVTSSVLWEIYEFVGDLFFTHTMQLGGNKDTMLDLLAGTAGGLAASVYSFARKEQL